MFYICVIRSSAHMFDGASATAPELPDGKAYFEKIQDVGKYPAKAKVVDGTTPVCATSIKLRANQRSAELAYDCIKTQTYQSGKMEIARER